MPIACDICGGPLVVAAGGKGAVCKNCGMEHSIERVREMLGVAQPEISPTVPQPVPVQAADVSIPAVPVVSDPGPAQAEPVDEALLREWDALCADTPERFELRFGEWGLAAAGTGILTDGQVEAVRKILQRYRDGLDEAKIYGRVFPGWEYQDGWIEVMKPGKLLFELSGMPEDVVNQCLAEAERQLTFPLCLSRREKKAAAPAAKPKNGTPKPNRAQTAKSEPKAKPNKSQTAKPKPKTKPYLELRNVCKTVDGVQILRNVNLQVKKGEKVFLVGHWEKEMLLCKMVAGLEPMTSGQINLDGVCLNNLEPKDRRIGIGSLSVYPHMTVYGNLAFGLKMKGLQDEAQIDQRVRWTAEQLDLTDWLQQKAEKLPAEQKVRCSVGRSLSKEPKLLFLWDPFETLEKEESLRLCADLERLLPHFGAVIVVVKDPKQAEYWSGSRTITLPSSCPSGISTDLPAGGTDEDTEEILDAQWIPL